MFVIFQDQGDGDKTIPGSPGVYWPALCVSCAWHASAWGRGSRAGSTRWGLHPDPLRRRFHRPRQHHRCLLQHTTTEITTLAESMCRTCPDRQEATSTSLDENPYPMTVCTHAWIIFFFFYFNTENKLNQMVWLSIYLCPCETCLHQVDHFGMKQHWQGARIQSANLWLPEKKYWVCITKD